MDETIAAAELALAIHRETGYRLGEARTHLVLGEVAGQIGDCVRARAHWLAARGHFEAVGVPDAESARFLLAGEPAPAGHLPG